ncbi:cuticle protein 18.7-like [Atheta coriaria]|uniref:cuticle protein 18.7-like n=1 Tax=Dalotia coriaria TaxID=877792 RepID=UPI0031F436B3
MKFLVVFAAALAVASAGFVAPVAPIAPVAYPAQHLPVIGPNGVPVDTPAVQQATAAHLAHKVEAHARNGDFAVYPHAPVVAAAAPVVAHAPAFAAAAPVVAAHGYYGHPAAYPTTAVHPTSVNGVPLETPEVVAAKTKHFAAHAEALARTGHVAGVAPIAPVHHLYRRSPVYAPYAYGAYGAYPYAGHAYGAYAYGAYPHYY